MLELDHCALEIIVCVCATVSNLTWLDCFYLLPGLHKWYCVRGYQDYRSDKLCHRLNILLHKYDFHLLTEITSLYSDLKIYFV
jgi:hypothetical protein